MDRAVITVSWISVMFIMLGALIILGHFMGDLSFWLGLGMLLVVILSDILVTLTIIPSFGYGW